MTDIAALPLVTTALPTVATGTTPGAAATTPATPGAAESAADPFAALLAALTPAVDADAATSAPAAPGTPIAIALPTAIAAPKAPAIALPAPAEDPLVAEQDGEASGDADADDTKGDADTSEDPALAMMLALAPPPPPATPIAAPVALVQPSTAAPATAASEIVAVSAIDIDSARPAPAKAAPLPQAPESAKDETTPQSAEPAGATVVPTPIRNSRFAALAAKLFGSAAHAPADTKPAGEAAGEAQPILANDATKPAATAPVSSSPDAARSAPGPRDPRAPAPADARMADAAPVLDRTKDQPAARDAIGPADALFAPFSAQGTAQTAQAGPASTAVPADASVTRELSVARDGQWLDTLARDIAATAGKDGQLSFRLDPHHLGSLTVHITHAADGASIRLSADTESGRAMLSDAQPRLVAEARAQGLTLRETSVDLGGSGAGNSGQQGAAGAFTTFGQGQSQRDPARDQTFINLTGGEADEPARAAEASAASDLYA